MTRREQGIFRLLVQRAWQLQCGLSGCAVDDLAAHEIWYRSLLCSVCRVNSSRDVTGKEARRLFAFLEQLCSDSADVTVAGFSDSQQAIYRRLVMVAFQRASEKTERFSDWYLRELDEIGDPGDGQVKFDVLVGHFACLAGDDYWIDRTSRAAEVRLRHVIQQTLVELSRLTGSTLTWSYVQGIHAQAQLSPTLEDCPAQTLRKILSMLRTHLRRQSIPASNSGIVNTTPF